MGHVHTTVHIMQFDKHYDASEITGHEVATKSAEIKIFYSVANCSANGHDCTLATAKCTSVMFAVP